MNQATQHNALDADAPELRSSEVSRGKSSAIAAPRRTKLEWLLLLALAITYIAISALKPIHIDDTCYVNVARQIAQHPTDPYGFEMYWYYWPEPAFWGLSVPLIPYWLSIAIKLFGDVPVVLKLWMFPFAMMYVFGVDAMVRRITGVSRPIVLVFSVIAVSGPSILPALNLMLDVPSVAMGLCALLLMLASIERNRWSLAILSGVVAGLAMQTKYTAFICPPLIFLWCLRENHWRRGIVSGLIAAAVFVGWESYTHWKYGQSHFLFHAGLDDMHRNGSPSWVAAGFVPLVGSAACGLLPLMLLACGFRGSVAWLSVLFVLVGYAGGAVNGVMAFAILGGATLAAIGLMLLRLMRNRASLDLVLLAWLLIEVVSYFALSPFPAMRRMMGMYVVLLLITARTLATNGLLTIPSPSPNFRRISFASAALTLLIGGSVAYIDHATARAPEVGVQTAITIIQEADPELDQHTIWYRGHWGSQYYAEKAGMKPVVMGVSLLKPGDWLIMVNPSDAPPMLESADALAPFDMMQLLTHRPAFRSVYAYYSGEMPFEQAETGMTLEVFRVNREFAPMINLSGKYLARWAERRLFRVPVAAAGAFVHLLEERSPVVHAAAQRVLESMDRSLLIRQLETADRPGRVAAAIALGKGEARADVIETLRRVSRDTSKVHPDVRAKASESLSHLEKALEADRQ